MSAKVAVVIPIYKEELDELEKISLAQVRKVLGHYPLVFGAPEGKNFSYLESDEILLQFPAQFFLSIKSYSQLLMSPMFYEPLLSFDYILIYQLDAFVFYDALEEFCRLGYDYIGAPWPYHVYLGIRPPKTPRVGNGGFSLRRVEACYKLLSKYSRFPSWKKIFETMDEDAFFTCSPLIEGANFNIAPVEVAKLFAMEWYPDRHVKFLENELPFGCHNWTKFSANFYVKLFAKFGYDLRPFKVQMGCSDYEIMLPDLLAKLALERLTRRVEREQPLLKYLPAKRFASVRVIRSPEAMKILSRLIVEDNSISDKLFIYDEKDFRNLIRDVACEDLPHLLLCTDYDKSLVEAIERKGLTYGEHVISFWQEYMKAQEKIFHSLGR